jgi:hypothetical protein
MNPHDVYLRSIAFILLERIVNHTDNTASIATLTVGKALGILNVPALSVES